MRRISTKYVATNVAILCLAIVPLTFAAMWMYNFVQRRYEQVDLEMAAGSAFAYTVTYFVPIALAGVLHAILVALAPGSWSLLRCRIGAAVLAIVVIPAVLLVFGQPWEPLFWFGPAIALGLVTYAFVMRLPEAE